MSAAITVDIPMATAAYSAYTKAEVVAKKSLAQIMAATVEVTELAAKWVTNKAMNIPAVDLAAVVAAADTATITAVDNTDSVLMMVVTADTAERMAVEVVAATVAAYTKAEAVAKKSFA